MYLMECINSAGGSAWDKDGKEKTIRKETGLGSQGLVDSRIHGAAGLREYQYREV